MYGNVDIAKLFLKIFFRIVFYVVIVIYFSLINGYSSLNNFAASFWYTRSSKELSLLFPPILNLFEFPFVSTNCLINPALLAGSGLKSKESLDVKLSSLRSLPKG